jgi:hypothetical protein
MKNFISNIVFLFFIAGILILISYFILTFTTVNRDNHSQKSSHKMFLYNKHHNYINEYIKEILFAYLKKHPEDIDENLKIYKFLDSYYLKNEKLFDYTSLDTITEFTPPEKINEFGNEDTFGNENEFELQKYLKSILNEELASKKIVKTQIDESPETFKSKIEFYVNLNQYDFTTSSFSIKSFDFGETNLFDEIPGICKKDFIYIDKKINLSESKVINIDNFKNMANYYIGNDRLNSDDFSYGILNFPQSRCAEIPIEALNLPKEEIFNYHIERSQSNLITRTHIPYVLLNFENLISALKEMTNKNIYIKNSNEAKEISTNHILEGVITIDFVPARDCIIKTIEETSFYTFKPQKSREISMICTPRFEFMEYHKVSFLK